MKIFTHNLLAVFFATAIAGSVFGMEVLVVDRTKSLLDNSILRFNIGGYHFDTTYSTIKLMGGSYLNTLLSGKFKPTLDHKGRYFIDRPKEEAKIVDYFMRNLNLPTTFDKNVVTSAAKYFGMELMLERVQKANTYRIRVSSYQCNECNDFTTRNGSRATDLSQHLLDKHQAEIITFLGNYSTGYTVYYRMPMKQEN